MATTATAAAWVVVIVLVPSHARPAGVAADDDAARRLEQASTRRLLALEDYYRLESVGSPAMSPDGRRVAFVRTRILEAENRRHSEIWIVPADGSAQATRLTSPAFSATAPVWSPDGRLLAFTSRRPTSGAGDETGGSIWFLRMDEPSGEAFQIPGVTATPVFSPDSRWIAMTMTRPGRTAPARTFASDVERRIHERFQGHIYDWMNYRFDGRGYLPDPRDPEVTPPRELVVVPIDGGVPRALTALGVDVRDVSWRPDSGSLAFTADTHQRDEHSYERADVFTVDLQGTVRRLTDDGFDADSPVWSPDGQDLVFRRRQGLDQVIESGQSHGSPVDLFRMSAGGGPATSLTGAWDLIPGPPEWGPDGRFIFFAAGTGGESHLFRMPAAGGAVEPITHGARELGGFSFSADFSRLAFTAETPVTPAELFTAAADASGERQLTAMNQALLDDLHLAPPERLRYPSEDGTTIEGWLMMPPGATGRVPLVLTIHGGPHSAYGEEFSFQRQLWAARGVAVLYTNPRGSTGYGERFLWATWGGWGNLDYDDVMAGVDYVLERYPIDERRMGVTGYSYGGFLTNWIITRTPRFAAAIVGAGISNWISDYGTADIPRTKETEFFGPPWTERGNDTLRSQSPIEHVGRARTPALFLHGESDFRVPVEQGEQMYTALRKQKVPARFVRYPDTSHGGWTPWNTLHRYHMELEWWAAHLTNGR